MKQLYSAEAAQRWTRRARRFLIASGVAAAVGLAVCIFLCTRVETGNASDLLMAVIGLSTLAGWAIILLLRYGYFPAKAEAAHISGVLEGEKEEAEGVLSVSPQRWLIPHSVAFLKATLRDGEKARVYNVDVHMAAQLPENGARVRVTTVRRFITAYEVQHEEN